MIIYTLGAQGIDFNIYIGNFYFSFWVYNVKSTTTSTFTSTSTIFSQYFYNKF